MQWRYLLADIPTLTPVAELEVNSRSFGEVLNSPGSFRATISLDDAPPGVDRDSLLPPDAAFLVELEGRLMFAGPVLGAVVDLADGTLELSGEGWHNLMRRRFISIDLTYTNVEQITIAKNLINYAQDGMWTNGHVGIDTSLAADTGILRTRPYYGHELPSIGEEVERLAQVIGGFDFRYEPRWVDGTTPREFELKWLTRYPATGRLTDIVLADGDTCVCRELNVQGPDIAYVIRAVGAGEGPTAVRATATNIPMLQAHYMVERTISMTDVSVQATLQAHADTELRRASLPLVVPRVEVDSTMLGVFEIGDRVRFRMERGLWVEDSDYRIVGWDCPDEDTVELTLSPLGLWT